MRMHVAKATSQIRFRSSISSSIGRIRNSIDNSRAVCSKQRGLLVFSNNYGTSTSICRERNPIIQIAPIVQEALQNGQPVVALESTIIAHGMPYPQNVSLSFEIDTILRNKNVIPATIAIKDGVCRIGLSEEEIIDLGKSGTNAKKCSTREISMILAKHQTNNNGNPILSNAAINNSTSKNNSSPSQWGATTVASTMFLANLAGISTFVTGGIGGVHRYGEVSMDISADLIELSRTPVIVVSAGIKSILDIHRTLEVLESYGVPTIGYQTDIFPAFFTAQTDIPVPIRMDTPNEIAMSYRIAQQIHMPHGFLVAVPNQDPAGAAVEVAIQDALREATDLGISGQAVTPFILRRVSEKTSGESLRSNIALVKQNAVVGADIAIAIADQRNKTTGLSEPSTTKSASQKTTVAVPNNTKRTPLEKQRVVIVGGIVLDIIGKPIENEKLQLYTSNPSICYESDGGVGRNIAEVLARLGSNDVLLYSTVGDDPRGKSLQQRLQSYGITSTETTISIMKNKRSATYLAILNENGDLHTACADMEVFNSIEAPSLDVLDDENIAFVVMDGNPPLETLQITADRVKSIGTDKVKVFLEPTSVAKAQKVAQDDRIMSCLTFASPNLDELFAMDGRVVDQSHFVDTDWSKLLLVAKESAERVLGRMNPSEAHLITTCGAQGVLLASKVGNDLSFQMFPPEDGVNVQNATGAGDTLAGTFIHSVLQGHTIYEAIEIGIEAATISLQYTHAAISPYLSSFQSKKYQ